MAVDMFMKIDGIKGESTDDKHKDESMFCRGAGHVAVGLSPFGRRVPDPQGQRARPSFTK